MKVLTFPLGANPRARLICYIQEAMMPGMTLPGAVLCPGGAYMMLSPREGEQMAMTFIGQGFHAFVVEYSLGLNCAWPQPVVEASIAMKLIRAHAAEWSLNPDQIFISGYSAGGHVASGLGVLWNDPEVQRLAGITGEENRPSAMLLCYPCVNIEMPVFENGELVVKAIKNEEMVGPHTPPAFIVHTYGDKMVSMEQSVRLVYAMSKQDRPVEFHLYTPGDHGSPMNLTPMVAPDGMTAPSVNDWLPRFRQWLDELWNPKPYITPPAAFPNAFTTREHFETLACLIRDGMGLPPTHELTPQSKLAVIAGNPAAMAVLREYVPALAELNITETACAFSIGSWLEYAGHQCGNPMFGIPADEAVDTCMARIRSAIAD